MPSLGITSKKARSCNLDHQFQSLFPLSSRASAARAEGSARSDYRQRCRLKEFKASQDGALVVILMGVSGAGKTTIGKLLASSLGWEFHDADDLHSKKNRAKMHHGIGLTDADRRPWLKRIRAIIDGSLKNGRYAIVACSALKESYRKALGCNRAGVKLIWLTARREVIATRIAARIGHFASRELLASQFADLEPPRGVMRVNVDATPRQIVAAIRRCLPRPPQPAQKRSGPGPMTGGRGCV